MRFIHFNSLDKNKRVLLLYIIICCGCFLISRLFGGVAPFDFDIFDSICQLIVFVPLLLYEQFKFKKEDKLKSANKNKINIYEKNNYKDYTIFAMFIILNFIFNIILLNRDHSLKKSITFINTYDFEILLGILMYNFYSNKLRYLHEYIHHVIITLLALGIDYIIYKYNNIIFDFPHIILFLLFMILQAINIVYKKYLIEVKNFSVYKLCTLFGILNIIFYLILIIIKNKYNNFMCFNEICLNFFDFTLKGTIPLIKIIISGVLCCINIYFFYSIIYHFYAPNVLIVFLINNFTEIEITIFTSDTLNIFYLIMYIILTILIMISFSVFLEVIEINLCGLNKNFRKNIIKREEYYEDNEDEDEKDKEKDITKEKMMVELPHGYIVDMNTNDSGNNIELE